jgi:hypothetical protein
MARLTPPVRTLALLFGALLAAACAAPAYTPPIPGPRAGEGVRLREGTPTEHQQVMGLLLPLMSDLGYAVERTAPGYRLVASCGVRVAAITAGYIQAAVLPGTTSPCTYLTLLMTEGALGKLPGAELQALLAHELAHAHLKHMQAFQALAISPATLSGLQFGRDQESEADRLAALTLKRTGGEPACLGLVALLIRINAEVGPERPEARSTHPNLANRIRETRRSCEIL